MPLENVPGLDKYLSEPQEPKPWPDPKAFPDQHWFRDDYEADALRGVESWAETWNEKPVLKWSIETDGGRLDVKTGEMVITITARAPYNSDEEAT